jgi:hypothetical protein
MNNLKKLIVNLTIISLFILTVTACKAAKPENVIKPANNVTEKTAENTYNNQEEKRTPINLINKLKKQGKKYKFKWYDGNSSKKKYVQIVWKWMLKDSNIDPKLDPKVIERKYGYLFNINGDRGFIFADLNNDKKEDFITLPGWSGNGPNAGWDAYVFLAPDYSKPIFIGMQSDDSLYILDTSTNGLRDLILNNKFVCKFYTIDRIYRNYHCN